MRDTVHRFVFEGSPVRGQIVALGDSWREILARHDYPEPVRRLLGETVAAASLLASTLKREGALILQMQGSGPVELLVVEYRHDDTLRATAKWKEPLGTGGLRELLGDGRFVISLIPEDGARAYQGVVNLQGDTVASAFEHYMSSSEQLETRIWLAEDQDRLGGMLLQRLPGDGADRDALWQHVTALADTVRPAELLALEADALLRRLYHAEDVRLFAGRPVAFRCSCTRDRVVAMLRMLGESEVLAILAERGSVEIACEFCRQRYDFDAAAVHAVFGVG